jgi:GNAT superfamily N-acetyltransferase
MDLTSIVPCAPEDFSDLRELHKAAINTAGWHFYSLAEVAAKLSEIDEPDYTITLLNENVLLAKLNNLLVGVSSWRPSKEHPQTAVITQLFLHPLFGNGGIASALIKKNEQMAYEHGFRWISAHADLNSREFFTRLGYETKGFKGCKSDSSSPYPLQIMTRHISSLFAGNSSLSGKLPVH